MEEKKEKLELDARLLSEAVIELNISRRSVGLYPPEHPIIKESIRRAFELLKRLFELRASITLGIAKNKLVVDEYTLDSKNPVFEEFALSLNGKGIAAITFNAGLAPDELVGLHELIAAHEGPTGKNLIDLAEKKGIRHIRLMPLDISSFCFVEGALRPGDDKEKLWEDYIYGVLEGKLSEADAEGILLQASPEDVALLINSRMPDESRDETYDRVISTYLRRKTQPLLSRDTANRFSVFLKNLSPELKSQFLRRTFSLPAAEEPELKDMLSGLKEEDLRRVLNAFNERSLTIPESLLNLLEKLRETGIEKGLDFDVKDRPVVDDIELDETTIKLFEEDRFRAFVSKKYQSELAAMLEKPEVSEDSVTEAVRQALDNKTIDSTLHEAMLELIDSEITTAEEYLKLSERLLGLAAVFLETGRLNELYETYNALLRQAGDRYRDETKGMAERFFKSEEFIGKVIDSFKVWGRHDREGSVRLAGALKSDLICPLLDALSAETETSARKFLLYLLGTFGADVIPEAIKRLADKRWYVKRNMIYLIRETEGEKYLKNVRGFARDKNKKVSLEALKTLLHFGAPDAPSYLKLYLRGDDHELKSHAIKLSGAYRVKEAVPVLIEILEKKTAIDAESYYKIPSIHALADIGDAKAIEHLIRIYNSKSLLHKGALSELKSEIFRTLHKYPRNAIRPLLMLGLNSKDEEIKSICENLLDSPGVEHA